MESLKNKVAFITGAARGQGRAHAVRLAKEGANIIAVDICKSLKTTQYKGATSEDLRETVRQIEALGRKIIASETDIRDFDNLSSVLSDAVQKLGRLDIVVANAGITTAAQAWEITAEQWQETLDVNLTGTFHTAKAAIPIMLKQGTGGSIIFTSSVAGLRGLPFLGAYVAAKHGVTGLAKTLANELGKHNIRVNSIHPHAVATGLTVPELAPLIEEQPEFATFYAGSLPDPFSQSEDISDAVLWLASDQSRHITGIQLPIDLGRTNH